MPLPVAHALLGASLIAATHPQSTKRNFVPLLAGVILANAADFDFILAFTLHSKAWHRGFSHSLSFALIVFLILVLSLGKRHIKEAISYGLAFTSHGVLDYATTVQGGGVELLWPFYAERFLLGWVGLSEVPSKLTGVEIVKALALEFILFAPLFMLVLGLRKYVWKHSRN